MNKAIAVLRGSKAKSLEAWMIEAKAADGTALHGAGNSRSEDWWKGFANVLLGQGLLASQSKTVSGTAAHCQGACLCVSKH